MLNDFDEINRILNEMAEDGILEPLAEPIDSNDCSPLDYAEVAGLWEEMYPEPLDSNDFVW